LKQAPRNFFLHLKSKLEAVGFRLQEDLDACLFISDKVICLVYVDDTLFYAPKVEYIDEVIELLKKEGMDLEVEGEVLGFLGVHIERNVIEGTISLTQKGLIKRIIEALEVGGLPIKKTPATAEPLIKDEDGEEPSGTFNYASVIGMLKYLQNHSRPDITFAVSQCAMFIHRPRRSHELAVIRIGQYLKGTMENGLVFKLSGTLKIDCYVDADFAGMWPHENPDCVKSRSGYVICLSECPAVWGSKLQGEISTSTMEAEYNALSMSMREVLPFKHLVETIAVIVGYDEKETTTFKTTVWEDNTGALTLARLKPGKIAPRSKHYVVKMHWFRSKAVKENIEIETVETAEQKADIFTKGLWLIKFLSNLKLLCGW
jgi:Reverse transcriptase (RNA-dependent DNA polymerase)